MKSILTLLTSYLFLAHLPAADWFAYSTDVSNFQIIPFDIQTKTPGTPIAAGRSEELAITPDASTLYVINRNILNTVSVIDLNSQTVINTIFLNSGGVDQQPFAIAITPDGTTAYITAVDSSNVSNLLELDLATNTYTVIPITPNIQADSLAITPDGSMIYLTQTSAVVGMTIAGNVFGTPIPVGGRTSRIAVTPDGLFAYVSDAINSIVYQVDLTSQTVPLAILLTSNSQPNNIAVSGDGRWLCLANENINEATVVDLTNYFALDIPIGGRPTNFTQQGVAISPDSKTAVFTNLYIGQIATIELATQLVTNTVVGGNPVFVAITPDQAPVASFTSTIAPPLSPSTFTSTSTTQVGTIASYFWDFGDGNTLVTAVNPVQHTYATGGTYTVTLTVTNSAGTSTTQTFTGQTVSNNGGPSATTASQINVPILPPPPPSIFPPIDLKGVQVSNQFLTQTDNVAILEWEAPTAGIKPVAYLIYGDAGLTHLIAKVPGKRLDYRIHNQKKNKIYIYYIVSEGPNGETSVAAPVTVTPHRT